MENIRNIKEKIKSCMSCKEDQCPFIKERLERHMLSHHSSSRQTVISQHTKPGRLSGTLASKRDLTTKISNDQTSTLDQTPEQLNKRAKQTMYKEGLEEIINEWAKQLPKYSNAGNENLKQNIVNELIEKLGNLSREANERYYDLKLAIEIDKFIDSLPTFPDASKSDFANLKESLVEKICDLNKKISNKNIDRTDRTDKKQQNDSLNKMNNNSASTQQSFKSNLNNFETQKDKTPYSSLSDNNEFKTDLNVQEKYNGKKLVDAQVQLSCSSFKSFYDKMFENPITKLDKQQNIDIMENIYKQIISNWLNYLTRKLDQNEKVIIADAISNRLKPLLNKKFTINHKILLRAEVLNCLHDYMVILISPENYSQTNRISDDLAVKLLDAKFNQEEVNLMLSRSHFPNSKDKMLPMNYEPENYFDIVVQNIVSEKLGSLNISNLIKRDTINIILQNIQLICMRQDHYIEALICDIFQQYTELSDYYITNIVKSILNEIRIAATNNYLHMYNSLSNYESYKLCRPSLISVYKSEHEILGPNESFKKIAELRGNYSQLTEDERTYINNISELINAWMTMLPTSCSKVSQKTKEGIIKNLAQDILDQVKLEQIVPDTKVEKEKYLFFFIHRMLNRLNCFKDISDAQPYAENLIKKIKNIPAPSMSINQTLDNDNEMLTPVTSSRIENLENREPIKNNSQTNNKDQNQVNTLKSEAILKEFIAKYIEHNYDEDNPLTREVFGHILKTELKKLSTPTRNKVYGDLNNQIDHRLTSEKLAKELQYINIISDWFIILPLESSFNVTGNKQRAQYVNDLAKIISDLEENRLTKMDYDKHLKSTVAQFIEKLPITKSHSNDMSFLFDDFIAKIASLRSRRCCAFGKDLSFNVSRIPDQNLSDFIEGYIRENSNDISDDELKLDAWALRLLAEVDNMASENPSALCTSQSDISVQDDEIGKRFNLELSYAKEISNWLNNLPLQRIEDKSAKDLRIKMISDLAEKMSVRWHIKNKDPNNTQVDADLVDYIEKWIKDLPLDSNKELHLPLLIQQILNRMERVNTGKQTLPLIQPEPQKHKMSKICKSPYPCCDIHISLKQNTSDPGGAIVEAIESWCKNLPIQSESESNNKSLKEEFSTNLYKKVRELNKNPDFFNNNFLYRQILGDEIDLGFDKLPQNPQLQNTRQNLKKQLLDIIDENRNFMNEKAAGVKYRQELAKTIEMSLPNPGPMLLKNSPGFNIYKNRLAELFILENFDNSQDDVKPNYVKRLRHELDKYFPEAQNMNYSPLTKEQMFNELYSSLFSVPPPNEISIIEEVEEVKTRCEIENWFENLPIRKASGLAELFERDKILSTLAKRLHYMEKYEKKSDDNIHKEITKWLLKLPIVSGQEENINIFANDLQQRLKATYNGRMCKPRNPNLLRKESLRKKYSNRGVLGTSQVAGPSSKDMPWLSPPPYPLPENLLQAPKRPSDLILDIVETWCQQLPLEENTQQDKDNAQLLKDNLVVKLIMKISELNVNPETFENDILYDVILDDELENLMSTLPTSTKLIQNKTALKNQFIDDIKSIKPLIMEEKARHEYKQELKNTVDQVLGKPSNLPPEKVALLITLREDIIDNFVAYSFCKDDEEGQVVHKMMVHSAVEKYYVGKIRTNIDEMGDPLIKGNQLLCELAKVPAPSAAVILEEIHEIRMKFQISDLFEELSLTDDANKLALKNQVKSTLARRLSSFNKTSFIQNRPKVRGDIMKSLHKVQNEIDPQKVEMFIEKLENSENRRISQLSQNDKNNISTSYKLNENYTNNENLKDEQWLSLLPATPRVHDPNYHDTIEFREIRKSLGEVGSPQIPGYAFDSSISQSGISYDKFKGGEPLSSSIINKTLPIKKMTNTSDKSTTAVLDQNQYSSIGPSNDLNSQGYRPTDNNANKYLESSPRSRNNSIQLQQPTDNNANKYLESSPKSRNNSIQPQQPADNNDNKYLESSPRSHNNFIQPQQPTDNNANKYLESSPRSRNNSIQPQQPTDNNANKYLESSPRSHNNSIQPQQPTDNNANKYLESSPRSHNNSIQPQQPADNNANKYLESSPRSHNNFIQPQQPTDNNANKYLESSPRSHNNSIQPQQPTDNNANKYLESSPRSHNNSIQPQQPPDNNANKYLESSSRSRNNSIQPQNLELQNAQPKLTHQMGARPDLQKSFNSPQDQISDSRSQEQIRSQKRKRSIRHLAPQSQISEQSGSMTPKVQNQISPSATTHQSKPVLKPSQITLPSPNVPSLQNQYRAPSSLEQISASQNIPGPSSVLPSDMSQQMPQFSSQTPFYNSRCNKNCRRPSIMLMKPPKTQCNKNQVMRGNIRPISDDDESICLCAKKRKKQCRGSPVCPMHKRKQCKICNEVNPLFCAPPSRRHCRY